jgi:hypothetical protein
LISRAATNSAVLAAIAKQIPCAGRVARRQPIQNRQVLLDRDCLDELDQFRQESPTPNQPDLFLQAGQQRLQRAFCDPSAMVL